MKLMTVRVKVEYVIIVEESDDPELIARNYFKDAVSDLYAGDMEYNVLDYETHPVVGWDGMCIPYGGDGNTRTKEYLKENK